jgi:hypothetical protein
MCVCIVSMHDNYKGLGCGNNPLSLALIVVRFSCNVRDTFHISYDDL